MEISHTYKEQHKPYLLSVPGIPQKFKFWIVDCLIELQFDCFGFTVPPDSHLGLTLSYVKSRLSFRKR